MVLVQAVCLGLIALIITPGFLFYFDVTPKVCVLLAGTALLLAAAARRGGRKARPARAWSILLALSGAWLALSAALSANPRFALIGTTWREFGLIPQLAILVFAWFAASVERRLILRAIAISSGLAAIYGIAQYFGIDPFLPRAAYHIGEGIWTIVRPPGTLGYVSYFAAWLVMATFLSLASAEDETSATWKLAAQIGAVLCAVAMLLTGTRAAMLALVCGALVWMIAGGFRFSKRAPILAGIAMIAAAAFYFSPAGWNLRSRARWYVEDPAGGGRPLLWRDSLRMAASKPIAGYGPEQFTAEFAHFESGALASKLPDFEYESAHNMFLDTLNAQGIPGLTLLLAVCGFGFAWAWRERTGRGRSMAAAITAGIVTNQFNVLTVPTALLLYTAIALVAPRQPVAEADSRRLEWDRALWLWPAAAALLFCATRLCVADRALAQANAAIAVHDVAAAAERYAEYERTRLPGPSADLWYSRSMLSLSRNVIDPKAKALAVAQAYANAARAPQSSDDPCNAWYNLAMFEAARDNAAAVEADLRKAIAARPNWFKPHWTLARLMQLEGRPADAQREQTLAAALDGGKHPEINTESPLH